MEQSAPLPRRIQMNLNFPAERAIFNAIRAVEALPASEKLTKVITLLAQAKEELGDYFDENKIEREFTFGEQLVGIGFNPSGDENVLRAKEICAELANLVRKDNEVLDIDNSVKHHLIHHTYGEILNAQMNVVKVLTLKP